MALTLLTMRQLIRSELNSLGTVILSDTELNRILNDGYKDVAIKALCYEKKIPIANIGINTRGILMISSPFFIKATFVEYNLGTSGSVGMMQILPEMIGFANIDGSTPQYWFQWGNYIIIEPLLNIGTYNINVYAACLPDTVMLVDADIPLYLPEEFHECVLGFGLAYARFKLGMWGSAASAYNQYINDVQVKTSEYVLKDIDKRADRQMPDNVTIEVVK